MVNQHQHMKQIIKIINCLSNYLKMNSTLADTQLLLNSCVIVLIIFLLEGIFFLVGLICVRQASKLSLLLFSGNSEMDSKKHSLKFEVR